MPLPFSDSVDYYGLLFPDSDRRVTTNWVSPQRQPRAAEWYNLLCSQIITNEQEQVVQVEQRFMPTMQLCDNPLTPDYTEEELQELRHRAQLVEAAQSTAAALPPYMWETQYQCVPTEPAPASDPWGSWIVPREPATEWQKSDTEYRARARATFMHSRRYDVASHVSQFVTADMESRARQIRDVCSQIFHEKLPSERLADIADVTVEVKEPR